MRMRMIKRTYDSGRIDYNITLKNDKNTCSHSETFNDIADAEKYIAQVKANRVIKEELVKEEMI